MDLGGVVSGNNVLSLSRVLFLICFAGSYCIFRPHLWAYAWSWNECSFVSCNEQSPKLNFLSKIANKVYICDCFFLNSSAPIVEVQIEKDRNTGGSRESCCTKKISQAEDPACASSPRRCRIIWRRWELLRWIKPNALFCEPNTSVSIKSYGKILKSSHLSPLL